MASTIKNVLQKFLQDSVLPLNFFKGITHEPKLGFDSAEIAKFMDVASFTGDKRGCILAKLVPKH